MWRAMVVVLVAAALVLVLWTRRERQHVALEAQGMWWCDDGSCDTSSSLVCRKATDCKTQARAACFAVHNAVRDNTFDICLVAMSVCDRLRERALIDRDLDGVGDCRVVSATDADREHYAMLVLATWVAAGVLVLVLLALAVSWHGARQGRRAA